MVSELLCLQPQNTAERGGSTTQVTHTTSDAYGRYTASSRTLATIHTNFSHCYHQASSTGKWQHGFRTVSIVKLSDFSTRTHSLLPCCLCARSLHLCLCILQHYAHCYSMQYCNCAITSDCALMHILHDPLILHCAVKCLYTTALHLFMSVIERILYALFIFIFPGLNAALL